MQDKDILEGNCVVAVFDGWVQDLNIKDKPYWHPERNMTQYTYPESFKYHSSWEWIMPVVRKFDHLVEEKIIPHSKDYEDWCDEIDETVTRTYEILPVFKILTEAIKWYNYHKNYIVRQAGNSRSVRSVWWEHAHGNVEGFIKLPLYNIEWLEEYTLPSNSNVERFKKPEADKIIKAAILFNDGRMDRKQLSNMVALCYWVIDRLYENGDITIPSSKENKEDGKV